MQERKAGTRTPGFSLLELVAGLALASVVTAVGVASMVELVRGARLCGAARTTATALRLARARALARGAAVEVRLDAGPATVETRTRAGATLETRRLPPGVVVAGLPASGRILFGALGTAENGTLTLTAGARERRIIVNQRGRVRVE